MENEQEQVEEQVIEPVVEEVAQESEQQPDPQEEEKSNVQQAINKKHWEMKQAQRDGQEQRDRADKAERELNEIRASKIGDIPAMPDPYDDNYEVQVAARETAIQAKATHDAQQNVMHQMREHQQAEAQREAKIKEDKEILDYTDRAPNLGISREDLFNAGNLVSSYGLSHDLTMEIVKYADGPLITTYLASNPLELQQIAGMSPMQGILHIERNIKGKLQGMKPKPTNAPAPQQDIKGAGPAPSNNYAHSKGATFD